jgi:hypothetical protein
MNNSLKHWGVPGMHWGRRSGGSSKSAGPPSADHATVSAIKRKKLSEMSNDDINKLITRTTLENQVKTINKSKSERGKKLVADLLGTPVKVAVASAVGAGASLVAKKLVTEMIKKAAWSAAKGTAKYYVMQ